MSSSKVAYIRGEEGGEITGCYELCYGRKRREKGKKVNCETKMQNEREENERRRKKKELGEKRHLPWLLQQAWENCKRMSNCYLI